MNKGRETQQLMQQVCGELGLVEDTPAMAVEGLGDQFIVAHQKVSHLY